MKRLVLDPVLTTYFRTAWRGPLAAHCLIALAIGVGLLSLERGAAERFVPGFSYGAAWAAQALFAVVGGLVAPINAVSSERASGVFDENRRTPRSAGALAAGYLIGPALAPFAAALVLAPFCLALARMAGLGMAAWARGELLVASTALLAACGGLLTGLTRRPGRRGSEAGLLLGLAVLAIAGTAEGDFLGGYVLPLTPALELAPGRGATEASPTRLAGEPVSPLALALGLQAALFALAFAAVARKIRRPDRAAQTAGEAIATFLLVAGAQHALVWDHWGGDATPADGGLALLHAATAVLAVTLVASRAPTSPWLVGSRSASGRGPFVAGALGAAAAGLLALHWAGSFPQQLGTWAQASFALCAGLLILALAFEAAPGWSAARGLVAVGVIGLFLAPGALALVAPGAAWYSPPIASGLAVGTADWPARHVIAADALHGAAVLGLGALWWAARAKGPPN